MKAVAKRTDRRKGGRFYTTPEGQNYPSVTNILGIISKPALINWAANMERELVVEASANMYEDLCNNGSVPQMNRAAYVTSLQNRLGVTKAHQKALTKAGEVGSQVHALIEWNIRKSLGEEVGPEPQLTDKAVWAFSVWKKWAEKADFKPIHCEQAVWSNEYQYAGTMDLMAEIRVKTDCSELNPDYQPPRFLDEGETYNVPPMIKREKIETMRVVVDWKTGKAIYPEALLQNVAYIKALVEMGHAKAPLHGLIVRLPKNEKDPEPETRLIPWAEQEGLFRAFRHARALWGWQYQIQNGSK